MKLSQVAVFVFLLLVFTIPEETEAALPVTWFLRIAAALGERLMKNAYYARCNVRYVPPGINCPSVAFNLAWAGRVIKRRTQRECTQVPSEMQSAAPMSGIVKSLNLNEQGESKPKIPKNKRKKCS